MQNVELLVYQLVEHHKVWRALQERIRACEFALETGVKDEAAVEALSTLHASLVFNMAEMRDRLIVIVREARRRVRSWWTLDGEIEELYSEFGAVGLALRGIEAVVREGGSGGGGAVVGGEGGVVGEGCLFA